nr:putative protein TPRXL [Procambarus clarkii]
MATASITSHVNSRVVYDFRSSSPGSSTPAASPSPLSTSSPGSSTPAASPPPSSTSSPNSSTPAASPPPSSTSSPDSSTPAASPPPSSTSSPDSSTLAPTTPSPNTQPTNLTEPSGPHPPTTTAQPPSTSPSPSTSETQETTASSTTTSEHSSPSQETTTILPTTPLSPEASPDSIQKRESSFRTSLPQAYSSHPRISSPQFLIYGPALPACAGNTSKSWCLEDSQYPTYQIKHAVENNYEKVLSLYAEVEDLNTELSVDRPKTLKEETYLCPSETAYVRPLRAENTEGKWRVIVNNIKAHYVTLTQSTRIEECLKSGQACPLVPECYESKCLQKSIYHRFLVYDPYDQYFPFAIETFKLPASCACLLDASTIDH